MKPAFHPPCDLQIEPVFTVGEVAKILKLSERQIRRLIADGRLESVSIDPKRGVYMCVDSSSLGLALNLLRK